MGSWLGHWCARPGSNRHGLPPPSQDGASTRFATSANVWRTWSDSNRRCFRDGLRIRSLGRWGHRSVVEDPGGFEPLAHGLKARSNFQSGLTLRIHLLDDCGGQPLRFRRRLHVQHSTMSKIGSPVRNRACVNRLSTGRSATELRDYVWCVRTGLNGRPPPCHSGAATIELRTQMVPPAGIEPAHVGV